MTPDSRSPEVIATSIRLKREQFAGVFLIVEGETDARLYGEKFTDPSGCKTQAAGNKQKAIAVLQILDQVTFTGALAIVDADFAALENAQPDSTNLFFTDWHDLDCMIFDSPAFDYILAEFVSEEKIRLLGKDIKQALVQAALPVGCLRWASLKNGWSLKFEGLDFKKFLDNKTLAVDRNKLVTTARNHSQCQHLPEADLRQSIATILAQKHPPLHLCCGHDLIAVLSFSMLKTIGTYNANEVRPEVMERSLRLAYEFAHFVETALYRQICVWEQANPPYRVFRQEREDL